MISTRLLRLALWATIPANFGVALLMLVPGSAPGQWLGLPASAPPQYSSMLALFVALFGGMYLWLVLQPRIHRPLLGLAAIGKALAFVVTTGLWSQSLVPDRWAALFIGDLLFAALFAGWLWKHRGESITAGPSPG